MVNRHYKYRTCACFGLIGLLLIFGLSCLPSLPPDPDSQATLGAVAAAVETTETRLNSLEPQVAENRALGQSAQAEAAAAKMLAETAIARIDAAETPPPPPASGSGVPLSGGVALGYEPPTGTDYLFYRADGLLVNRNYSEFRGESNQLDPNKTLVLGLVETQQGANTWHLLYSASTLPMTITQTIRSWSEYTIFAHPGPADAGGDSATVNQLIFEEGPRLNIVAATEFPTASTLSLSLDEFELALEDQNLSLNLTSRLLLLDESEGVSIYTLVAVDPGSPAGGDSKRWYCRVTCRWRYCTYFCR